MAQSNSKWLHFALHHNEGCKDNSPQLVFNTKTNGKFDTPEIENVTEILNGYSYKYTWSVSAEEDGYLIEQYRTSFSYKFKYRSLHQLSDVEVVKLYALSGCGGSTDVSPESWTWILKSNHRGEKSLWVFTCFYFINFIEANMPTGYEVDVYTDAVRIVNGIGEKNHLNNPVTSDT